MSLESSPVLALLAVLVLCAAVTAVTVVVMAVEMRRTLRRINGLLPQYGTAIRQANALLARANRITRDMERLAHQASETALGWLQQAAALKHQAQSFIAARLGNGHQAGAEPRRAPGRRR